MPKVSVIMPLYNSQEDYLRQAIESILTQTFTNFEFLILDDSTEGYREDVVKSYHDKRIVYYKNDKNIGIAESYNKLIKLANGEYVALMNHDDISLPERLQKEVDFLDNNKEIGLVGSGYKKFGKYNRFLKVYPPVTDEEIKAILLFKSPIHNPTIMFRRKIVKENNIMYDSQFISLNDRKFYFDIGQVSGVANIHEILYKYRFHKQMTSKVERGNIVNEGALFHHFFLAYYNIEMTSEDQMIFDQYVTCGRRGIESKEILYKIKEILEKLVLENQNRHFLSEQEFSKVCALYLVKRCCNAAIYGKINSTQILKETKLPVKPSVGLRLWNYITFRKS